MPQTPYHLCQLQDSIAALKRLCFGDQDTVDSEAMPPPMDFPEHDHFFRYNSGRWIYNEREQMDIRYASFNVDTLKQIATTAADANCCLQMDKIAEGSFNKIFLLTLDNDVKLVAKIPCPLVAPRRLCTASEVATMDYARNILNLPVPRVLKYSADADTSELGTEYILMEHVDGVELYKRMDKFGEEAMHFVDQVVDMECKFTRHHFSQIGSLYYKEDVSAELQQRPLYAAGVEGGGSDRFRIGPCVNFAMWRGKRGDMDVDRGPWPDALSYIKALVNVEKQWLSTFAVPYHPRDQFYRPGDENSPDAHIRLLDNFLKVVPFTLPPDELCMPVLWHGDLHASNIFVPPQGSADILGLIDWQHACIRPLFLQASFAPCVRYEGDDRITIPPGMAMPILPPDFDTYSDKDKEYLKGQKRLGIIHKYYEVRVMQRNLLHVASQTYPHIRLIIPPILCASRTWYQGMHRLRQVLMELQDVWEDIAPGTAFPITWDKDEVAAHRAVYPERMAYEARTEEIIKGLQLEGDGWVANERYDEVLRISRQIKGHWKPELFGGPYPFQDGGRSWFLS